MAGATTSPHIERNCLLTLRGDGPVNPEWLEEQAIRLEDVLIERGRDLACGFSVTANFAVNGWEVDFTVQTETMSDVDARIGQVVKIIEDEIGFSIESENAEATASATVAVTA